MALAVLIPVLLARAKRVKWPKWLNTKLVAGFDAQRAANVVMALVCAYLTFMLVLTFSG